MVRYRASGCVRYWKPIQTGIEQDDDTQTVSMLTGDPGGPPLDGIRLPRPLSPHLSARLAGQTIDLAPLKTLAAAQSDRERFVVEGAGGLLVPLNDTQLIADLIRELQLPVLVVARSTLGTINHTLLTVEALRARQLDVAGVVMNGPPNDDNRASIERYGEVEVLAQVPAFERIDRDTVVKTAALLDPNGRLLQKVFA